MKTYNPSGHFGWTMRKRAFVVPLVLLFGFIVIPDLLFGMERLVPKIVFLGPWILLLILISFVMGEVSNYFFNKSRINIGDDFIERANGKSKDVIKFIDIIKVKINSFKSEIHTITIKSKKSKMIIISFEEMNKIVELIKQNLDDPSIVQEKSDKLPMNSPYFQGLVFVLAGVALSALYEFNPDLVYSPKISSVGFIMGSVFFLFWRPVSAERGKKYLFLDIFFVLLFLVGAALFFFMPMN